ncbi:50S ribosomal protein L29 [Patescibacteria group bacterium]|nr:MAG: 50S ribosomal protein L29 [Patescibacteria group bacterium]
MKDLKDKTEKDLEKMLREKREALRAFRFGVAGSKVRNVKEGRALRKDIARLLTELSGRKTKVK